MSKEEDVPVSIQLLSSGSLTGFTVLTTLVAILLLFINDHATGLRILFTVVAGAQFLFMVWMLVAMLSVLYDSFMFRHRLLNISIALDFYVMYILVWLNTGILFWLWDRDGSFTHLNDSNPFFAWLSFLFITMLIIHGMGFGRYIPDTLLAESWCSALSFTSQILMLMILTSVIALTLNRVSADQRKDH